MKIRAKKNWHKHRIKFDVISKAIDIYDNFIHEQSCPVRCTDEQWANRFKIEMKKVTVNKIESKPIIIALSQWLISIVMLIQGNILQ